MQESIVFCSACMMSSLRKFAFAISSPDEFLVLIVSFVVSNSIDSEMISAKAVMF